MSFDDDVREPEDGELSHLHVCAGCGAERVCEVMICRDPRYARPCWGCELAGRA